MFSTYVLLFLGFGVIGWAIDNGYRKITPGEYKPATVFPFFATLWGIAGVSLMVIYQFTPFNTVLQILLGGIAVTLVELFGGLFCVHVRGRRMWDYSDNKYNFYGYIDVKHTIYWFILAAILRFLI